MRFLVTVFLFVIRPLAAQETTLAFAPAETQIEFTLPTTLHTVHGTFALKSGKIRFDASTGKADGELIVDAASGASGNDGRDKRMHKEIIESARYLDISFLPDRVEGKIDLAGTSEVRVHGLFKIHGIEKELMLPVKTEASAGKIVVTAAFSVPYVEWGMKNPTKLFLKVDPVVEVHIKAIGRR
jgi:polyisoprenoid-binding protein YceI